MRLLLIFLASMATCSAHSYEFKLALLHANSEVFDYEISVLKLALKNAPGEHTLTIVTTNDINQARLLKNLTRDENDFNVFFSGFSKERERELLQVDFPITRGLLGYRVFAISEDKLGLFANIADLTQFKKQVTVGSGIGWPDTEIFKHNGFDVIQTQYDGLWKMLRAHRITAFNRGINEAFIEIAQQNQQNDVARLLATPKLVVEPNFLVVYPFDYFFYVSPLHPELHQTIKDGLKQAIANGDFKRNFYSHPRIKQALEQLALKKRKILSLDNPLLSDRIRALPKSYWHQAED
jgi:hypothetical protein